MKEIILETLLDTVKLIPFLFIAFLIMELIEHKLSKKQLKKIENSGKYGPIIGSILGMFPQCGFSVAATNLFSTRIITMGTLIAVYLSTSDEMLPILLSQNVDMKIIASILTIKVVVAIMVGLIIDLIIKNKKHENDIKHFCDKEHCHCEENIFLSVIKHTINILIFILVVNFVLNALFEFVGTNVIEKLMLKNNIFQPIITSLLGMIPNCGASVVITELYLSNIVSYGSMIAGLLSGSGIALIVLFKENKNMKENLKILLTVYGVGIIVGIILNLILILI